MLEDVKKLGLPLGVWQEEIKKILLPFAKQKGEYEIGVTCSYPDTRTLRITACSLAGFYVTPMVAFSLTYLQGCKAVIVSHGLEVMVGWRGKGISTALMKVKYRIAKDMHASLLLATVRKENESERHILNKEGWEERMEFLNTANNHELVVYTKLLEAGS